MSHILVCLITFTISAKACKSAELCKIIPKYWKTFGSTTDLLYSNISSKGDVYLNTSSKREASLVYNFFIARLGNSIFMKKRKIILVQMTTYTRICYSILFSNLKENKNVALRSVTSSHMGPMYIETPYIHGLPLFRNSFHDFVSK